MHKFFGDIYVGAITLEMWFGVKLWILFNTTPDSCYSNADGKEAITWSHSRAEFMKLGN
jgi:hypothetical protein